MEVEMMAKKFYRDPKDATKGWIPWGKDTKRASYYRIRGKGSKIKWSGPLGAGPAPTWLREIMGWK